jgi:hypothetical protein
VEKYDESFMAMYGDDVGGWGKKSMMRDVSAVENQITVG